MQRHNHAMVRGYPVFERGYEALKQATRGFTAPLLQKTLEAPVIILVLRTMLGFTPPEWAYDRRIDKQQKARTAGLLLFV